MTNLLVTLILLLAAFSLSYLIRSSLLISLPTAIFGITAVLYLFGLFNQLLLGFWVVLTAIGLATIASAILLIKTKELVSHLRSLLSPGLAIFLTLGLFSFLLTRGMQLSSWDEFSHWGTIVKATYLYDAVGPYNPVTLDFRSYPPSLSLFEYFVTKLGGAWLEGNIFFAYQLIIWSLFTPFLSQLTWRRWGRVIVVVPLMFIAPLAFFNSLNVTLSDPLLGMLFGYALAIAYVGNILQWRLALHVGLAIFMLTLAKDAGTFMAALVVVLFLIRLFAAKKTSPDEWSWRRFTVLGSIPALSLIISNQSWAALVRERVASPAFSGPIDLAAFFGAFRGDGPSYWQEILLFFEYGVSNYPVNPDGSVAVPQIQLILIFIVVLAVLEIIFSRRMGRKFGLALLGVTTSGAIVYTIGLLALYLFRFAEWEAVRLASYERYLGTYWAGVVLCVTLVTIWLVAGSASSEQVQGLKGKIEVIPEMVLVGIVFLLSFALSPAQKLAEFFANPNGYSSQLRAHFEPAIEQVIQAGIDEGDKVWIIAQHTRGFDYWVLRYSLMGSDVNLSGWSIGNPSSEEDIWTIEKTAADWAADLRDFDYVLFFDPGDNFMNQFGSLFTQDTEVEPRSVFQVSVIEDKALLSKVTP